MIVENYNVIKATKTPEVSASIDPLTTQTTLGTIAQGVSESNFSPAATKGYIMIDSEQGTETYIGQYALTPKQLENAGIIKPGSSALVESLMASGTNIEKAMPPAIFTGKAGAKDYNSFVTNIPAQSNAMVKNLQVSQTSLQNAGLITGAEAPSEINGVILSAANNGVDKVLEAVNSNKNINDNFTQRQPVGRLNQTYKDIQSGNYAGKIAESGLGTLSGIETSLQALSKTSNTNKNVSTGRGLQADAFETIKNSIPNLVPNVPNDLIKLQTQKNQSVTEASQNAANNKFSQEAQGAFGIKNINTRLQGGTASVGTSLLDLAGMETMQSSLMEEELPSLLQNSSLGITLKDSAVSTASGIVATTASSLAAGLNNLPGLLGSVTSITDYNKGNSPIIPGTENMQLNLKNLSTDTINNVQNDLLSPANSLLGQDSLESNVNGLIDLISSKLPAGSAALLQNAIGSIASSGLGLKSPSAAINTVPDRQTIATELKNAMNDPAIPEPNYIGVNERASGKIQQTAEDRKQFITKQKELKEKYKKANDEFISAYTTYAVAQNNLPQGSSIISGLKAKYEAKAAERNEAKKNLDNLYKEFPEFAIRNVTDTSKNSTKT
jgi:hypothetical protein